MDIQLERFKDIYEFDRVISSRKNNEIMRYERDSQRESSGWSGTRTWAEAENMLQNGWSTKVEEMKTDLAKYSNKVERTHIKHKPNVAGFAPIVPAAIKGVPKAMWANTPRKKVDQRCLHIYYNNSGSSKQKPKELIDAGMSILKLCVLLEKIGIRVKIDVFPIVVWVENSLCGCSVSIKDYKQPLNIHKMAYPIAHVSMLRRQGFKWLETFPTLREKRFNIAYGYTQPNDMIDSMIEQYKLNEECSVYINYYECKECGFDAEKLALKKGILLENKGGK